MTVGQEERSARPSNEKAKERGFERTLDDHLPVESTIGVRDVARVETDDVGGSVLHQGTGVGEGGLSDG